MTDRITEHEGEYLVLRKDQDRIDLAAVGDIVAEVTGESKYDARAKAVHGRGVLTGWVDSEKAKKVRNRLEQEMGIKSFVVAGGDLWLFPPALLLDSAQMHERGGIGQAVSGEVEFEWKNLRLYNYAWVGQYDKETRFADQLVFQMSPADLQQYDSMVRERPSRIPGHEREKVLDLFFDNPPKNLRLEESRFKFYFLPDEEKTESWSHNSMVLVKDIAQWAPQAEKGPGVVPILEKGRLPDLFFTSYAELNHYNFWLNQICCLKEQR